MTDRYLRTGIFLAPFHALDENPTLALKRDMQLIEKLDELGYDEVWIGEHDHVFWRAMRAGAHHLDADEPLGVGGGARGPTPYDLLLMALGACTSMTLRRYALRKGYALSDVQVRLEHERIHAQDCAECGDREGKVERITRVLQLHGPLSQEQRADLVRIADRCPVHRTLENQPLIVTRLAHDD